MNSNKRERRNYFRINDVIGLRYAIIDSADDFTMEARGDMEMPLLDLLKTIDRDINEGINTLWGENALAADTMGLLNRKISLIAAHILQEDSGSELTYDLLIANISGCGMAFQSVTPITESTQLRVAVVLKPSNIELRFTARVVACERLSKTPASSYLLRLNIDEECTGAKEQLVQHVVQRQFANQKLPGTANNARQDESR